MGDKGVHAFPLGISPKVNVIARLKFELGYDHVAVHYVCYNATETHPPHYEIEIKVKLATLVEGDPKAPFSIATPSRCTGGHYSCNIAIHEYVK